MVENTISSGVVIPPDIINNNTTVSGGTWIASLNSDGVTVYTSGTQTVSGPINLWNANLQINSGAVVSDLVSVATGTNGTITVSSGGTIEDSYAANGYLKIQSGGISLDNGYESVVTTVSSGGSSTNDSYTESYVTSKTYGTLNGTAFLAGDNGSRLTVANGGYISNPSIINENVSIASSANYNDHGTAVNIPDFENGHTTLSGGTWVASLNSDGVTVYTSGSQIFSGPINLWNASLKINSGAVVSGLVSVAKYSSTNGAVTVSSGGTIESSYTANGYLNISSGGISSDNKYESVVTKVYSGGSSVNDSFTESYSGGKTSGTLNGSAFTAGDNISSVRVYSGGSISNPYLVNESLTISKPASFDPCFLAGSLIRTPDGEIPVEDIVPGDNIIAYVNGSEEIRQVIWTTQSYCDVQPHFSDDLSGYPVRILRGAIADGVPSKDMLITAEHCLFLNGKFIPSRMLVNKRSIFYDKSITSYDYYHIETQQHSVIMADGMLTESYLNTANHRSFYEEGNVISFIPRRQLTWADAAVPLDVSRDFVEPLFRQVEDRAIAANLPQKSKNSKLTEEADLHLLTDSGICIRPVREHHGNLTFVISSSVQSVRIVSNASRPSDVIGPFVDDRRYFGVAVCDITLFENGRSRDIITHLTDKDLIGWNTLEWEDCRWTSGNAFLPLGERNLNTDALLVIKIRKMGPYLLTDKIEEKIDLIDAAVGF
ncbi:Hint domain-containing protein [Gluconobacter kondonii]|uniref:Hint domain-containing protein n=1 Tax=Gluconobacter kondonii TaxID=941463 RepID=UPI001B8BBF61|nr:Hint domain-containing protein [Gluconobacter kondonii]MBS1054873.1 Hint domain-containing protein [Gluconobacter kondonii]